MVGRYAHLDGVLVGEEVDDLERVRDDADGQELLAVVAALHHHAESFMNMQVETLDLTNVVHTCPPIAPR